MLLKRVRKVQPREKVSTFDFSEALLRMKSGKAVSRRKDFYVVMMGELRLPPSSCQEDGPKVNARTAKFIGKDASLWSQPYFASYDESTHKWQPGWLPSAADLMSEGWFEHVL